MSKIVIVRAAWDEARGGYKATLANRPGLGSVFGPDRKSFNKALRIAARDMKPQPSNVFVRYGGSRMQVLIVR